MSLQKMVGHVLQGAVETIKRNAIGYAICAVCGVAVIVLATGAGVLALVPLVGAVYALLIAAGVYLVVIIATMLWLQSATPRPAAARATTAPLGAAALGVAPDAAAAQKQVQFAQLAMIIEAVALGYSLSRKR